MLKISSQGFFAGETHVPLRKCHEPKHSMIHGQMWFAQIRGRMRLKGGDEAT